MILSFSKSQGSSVQIVRLIVTKTTSRTTENSTAVISLGFRAAFWSETKNARRSHVREISLDEIWRFQKTRASEFLGISEFEEEVKVSHENTDNSKKTSIRHQHVETKKNPWQVHRLKSCAEPEAYYDFFVELAPNVENRKNHRIHKELEYVTLAFEKKI